MSDVAFQSRYDPEFNRLALDYRRPMPPPAGVPRPVVDFHCHLIAARHADVWFDAADTYGIDVFFTMTPPEEAARLARSRYADRLHFIAVPTWADDAPGWDDRWKRSIDLFHGLGARVAKFHMAPRSIAAKAGADFDDPGVRSVLRHAVDRGMAIMSHVGDPDAWYRTLYARDFGTRDGHYAMWERALDATRGTPWIGAHLGGNPEDLPRLQRLLDRFPDLWLDMSATKWVVREISKKPCEARDFILRNADRLLWGSDQVSAEPPPGLPIDPGGWPARSFDFLASRFWCHRTLWETGYDGESPVRDADAATSDNPAGVVRLRGLWLPSEVLGKLYHANAVRLLRRVAGSRSGVS